MIAKIACTFTLACCSGLLVGAPKVAAAAGQITIFVVDDATGDPLAFRVTLERSNGKSAPLRDGIPAGTGAAIDGKVTIRLPADTYSFKVSHGPEYKEILGTFVLNEDSEDEKTIRLPRILSMLEEGWIAGDPLAKIPEKGLELRTSAEEIKVVGILDRDFAADIPPAEPYLLRGSGNAADLLAVFPPATANFDVTKAVVATELKRLAAAGESGPSSDFVRQFRKLNFQAAAGLDAPPKLVVLNPMASDLPFWLASDSVDGMVVMGEFLQIDRSTITWPQSRKPTLLEMTGPHALGKWSLHVYQQLLEAGFRIVPIGTGGSGFQKNPVGYSRTYVATPSGGPLHAGPLHAGQAMIGRWWEGMWAGETTVSSGPLLRPLLENQIPGHTFKAIAGQNLELTATLKLAIRDPVDYLQVIQNGRVVYNARLDEFARKGGRIPPLHFDSSGWAMVQVVTKYEPHLRAAISAPWFVDFDNAPRISAKAVDFFQKWLVEREQQLASFPPTERDRHVPYVRAAREFWSQRASLATVP